MRIIVRRRLADGTQSIPERVPPRSVGTRGVRFRQAFTIVELLVSMALIVLIMAILSEAFVAGLGTFHRLKAIGDTQEKMRTATINLRLDLLRQHFRPSARKLSSEFYVRPSAGFFRIQGTLPTPEGIDGDGIPSSRATDHILHFSVRLTGVRREDYFSARVPASTPPSGLLPLERQGPAAFQERGLMNSQNAEVAYWLQPTGEFAGTTRLHTLHRRIRLAGSFNPLLNPRPQQVPISFTGAYAEVSCQPDRPPGNPNFLYFNDLTDLADPKTRSMMNAARTLSEPKPMGTPPESISLRGDDVLLSDVISFEVKVLRPGHSDFEDVASIPQYRVPGSNPPFGVYDTANFETPTIPPNDLWIVAVQVVLRVWHFKTQQTRQITVIQDM